MAKKRLNKDDRELLNDLVIAQVNYSKSTLAKLDKAKKTTEEAILKYLNKKFPPEHMLILEKYGKAQKYTAISIFLESTYRSRFEFKLEKSFLYTGSQINASSLPPTKETKILLKKVKKFKDLLDTERAKLKKTRRKYEALIQHSRYFEDVVAVWPEAKELESDIVNPSNTACVSEDLVSDIKKDVKRREKEKKGGKLLRKDNSKGNK